MYLFAFKTQYGIKNRLDTGKELVIWTKEVPNEIS